MIKGIVPDFGYDVKLAITVDQEKKDNIPESSETKESKYYRVGVSCSNDVKGEWDYNAWNLKLNNVVEGTKCNLTFTSNMSKEEHDNIIKEGVAYRRNTYRGKDITSYYEGKEKVNNRDLYDQIGNCTFDDIYVGDYIKTNTNGKEVIWLIADLNNYLHTGNTDVKSDKYPNQEGGGLEICHATIIPAEPLENAPMNETPNTVGGYKESEMYTTTLGTTIDSTKTDILNKYIVPIFKNHIIEYKNIVSSAVNKELSNQYGANTGASSGWAWADRYLDLMGEINVYGTIVSSSSLYDVGIDNQQYAIFELKPEFINSYGNQRFNYWLKAVTYYSTFARVSFDGVAVGDMNSTTLYGVRPRFLID